MEEELAWEGESGHGRGLEMREGDGKEVLELALRKNKQIKRKNQEKRRELFRNMRER